MYRRDRLLTVRCALWVSLSLSFVAANAKEVGASAQCAPEPKDCLALALTAMGGRERLEAVKSLNVETVQHVLVVEQSYRQEPFLTSYARTKQKIDFAGQRLLIQEHLIWPESDPGQSESDSTSVVGPAGAVYRSKGPDQPASLVAVQDARYLFGLGPMRVLLTAAQTSELRYAAPEWVRSTLHPVLTFDWHGQPIKVLINPYNHLPDAVESVSMFADHWHQWGDVRQRVYFDNWQTFHGLVYPTNEVVERNGVPWQSRQVIAFDANPPINEADFKMDADTAQKALGSKGWESPFKGKDSVQLAAGITLYPGSWNVTIVRQDDGLVLLEAPISGTFFGGVVDKAEEQNPGLRIKAVLSTSDSWPHVGGVRQAVALGLPVYILDLNKPLLDRLMASPRHLQPDLLAQSPRRPVWRTVSEKIEVGSGANRMVLYPLRGASTERQYMVYFPEHQLLYASDTLVLATDGSLPSAELTREVVEAVKREHLAVTMVFAMHQKPVPWSQVTALVAEAMK